MQDVELAVRALGIWSDQELADLESADYAMACRNTQHAGKLVVERLGPTRALT
jgi:hypothetical protein